VWASDITPAAEQKAKAEAARCKAIDDGVPVPDIARDLRGEVGGRSHSEETVPPQGQLA
jgi:hypothetical protein